MDWTGQIAAAAARYGVLASLAVAVAEQESGYTPPQQFNPDGSLIRGSHGEIGMYQLMPNTAAGLGVDPSDPSQNIDGGVRYLARMIGQFGLPAGLYAYNWGPANVTAWQRGAKPLPDVVAAYGNDVLARTGTTVEAAAAPPAPPPNASPVSMVPIAALGVVLFLVLVS